MGAGALARLLRQTSDAVPCDEFIKLDMSLNSVPVSQLYIIFNVKYFNIILSARLHSLKTTVCRAVHNKINIQCYIDFLSHGKKFNKVWENKFL